MSYNNKIHKLDHPLIQYKVSMLRDKETETKEFREIVGELGSLMTYEATRELETKPAQAETPLRAIAETTVITQKVTFVSILRSGNGLLNGALSMLPSANVGQIGVNRTKERDDVNVYYTKLPKDISSRNVIVLDLMLAMGGCASRAISIIKEAGAKNIKFLCVLAHEDGLSNLIKDHPDLEIYVAAIDTEFDDEKHIYPGLGDGGNRLFGTE